MTDMLERQMPHDVWATERLIAHVRKLDPAQLELNARGTYGTIRKTLTHIVASDEGYLVRLLGTVLHEAAFTAQSDADLDEIAPPHARKGCDGRAVQAWAVRAAPRDRRHATAPAGCAALRDGRNGRRRPS
jgi:uncharacterized damage-inducible protein DinB